MMDIKKIGITGGIGSGKTTVCDVFRTLQIPVYEADKRAKELMNEQGPLREQLSARFGAGIYADGVLDRKRFAGLLFGNEDMVRLVNSMVHPAVMADFELWASRQRAPYVLHEAAILFETGLYRRMDANILVTAPRDVRLQRVLLRDGTSREAVEERMQHQWDDEKKRPMADYLITNDNIQLVVPQVLQIHAHLTGHVKNSEQ